MDRINVLRTLLELKFEGKKFLGQPGTRWFSQVLDHVKKTVSS
jgi:hypothetical protein